MSTKRSLRLLAMLAVAAMFIAACGSDDSTDAENGAGAGGDDVSAAGNALDVIKERGTLKCGTRDALPGFAVLDDAGDHVGFDADFCRVIAAYILGDADAVEFVDLETSARFTALQSGEVDVLVRNTTWTAGRDGLEGATFLQPNYYDGQAMMVGTDSGFDSIADMGGTSVCVASGTTTESNVQAQYARLDIELIEVLSFDDVAQVQEAFIQGRCEGWSSDFSQLVGLRSEFPDGPDALKIFDDIFSKEPLAPAVRDGEVALGQAVDWAVYSTIQAEEFQIDSTNIGDFSESTDPDIRKFLGLEEEGGIFDPKLGVPTDANVAVIEQVGNYAEIFERNLAPLGFERGLNQIWTEGGLLYAPPFH